jgi:Protein of unknown function (DUF3866)
VAPVNELMLPLARPVAVLALHGQLAAVAWAFAQAAPGGRLGYVQTGGRASPGGHTGSAPDTAAAAGTVGALLQRGLLAGHLIAGTAAGTGGDGGGEPQPDRGDEPLTAAAALHHGLRDLGWDAAVCDHGRDDVAEGDSPLGDGAMAALDCAHTALALSCPVLVVARMSRADPRRPRGGIARDTLTVLDLLLEPVSVALPAGVRSPVGADLRAGLRSVFGAGPGARDRAVTRDGAERPPAERPITDRPARIARHDWRRTAIDLPGFAAAGLGWHSGQGRGPVEDPLFFGAALAGGSVLAELAAEAGYGERDGEGEGAAA